MTEKFFNKQVCTRRPRYIRHVFIICVLTTNGSWHRNQREFFLFLGGKKSKQHPVFIYFLTELNGSDVIFIISKKNMGISSGQVEKRNRWPMGLDEIFSLRVGRPFLYTSGVDDDDHNDRTSLKKKISAAAAPQIGVVSDFFCE